MWPCFSCFIIYFSPGKEVEDSGDEWDDDAKREFEGNSLMVKKKDVILVNICFRELLTLIKGKQIYLALTKKQTKFSRYCVVVTHNTWLTRFFWETDFLAKVLNSLFVNTAKYVNEFPKSYSKRWLLLRYGTIRLLKKHQKHLLRSGILVKLPGVILCG